MEKFPLVTIITPSYNQGKFIEDTLKSVKIQQYHNIEHIIIDGGSSDNTVEILKKYQNSYNISWISEPDSGQVDALEKGFRLANGEILTWLNSDDYFLDDTVIQKVVEYFYNNQKIDVVTGNGQQVDQSGKLISLIISDKKFINADFMRYADYIFQPSTFFRSSVLNQVSLNKEFNYAFDWLFFLEIFENNYKFLVVDDFFSAYRIHDAHKTGGNTASRKQEISRIVKRSFGIFKIQTLYCYTIYYLFLFSEFFPKAIQKYIKRSIGIFIIIIGKISRGRIYSC